MPVEPPCQLEPIAVVNEALALITRIFGLAGSQRSLPTVGMVGPWFPISVAESVVRHRCKTGASGKSQMSLWALLVFRILANDERR